MNGRAAALPSLAHGVAVAVLVWASGARAVPAPHDIALDAPLEGVTWIAMPGPSGGGGGRREGIAVPVLVSLEIAFNIH